MATPAEMIAAIDEALGSGESEVRYDGKSTTYRSIDELLRARAHFAALAAAESTTPPAAKITRIVTRAGW